MSAVGPMRRPAQRPKRTAGWQLILPAQSLTTVVLEKFVVVGPATSPSPVQNETNVGYDTALGWSTGSNALMHAVYLGASSNTVALATPASLEFKGNLPT